MRATETRLNGIYRVTKNPTDSENAYYGGDYKVVQGDKRLRLKIGDILKCTRAYVSYTNDRSSINSQMVPLDHPDIVIQINNHRFLTEAAGIMPQTTREEEITNLEYQLPILEKEITQKKEVIKSMEELLKEQRETLRDARARLRCLKQHETDEEALAASIKKNLGKEVTPEEISLILHASGVKFRS